MKRNICAALTLATATLLLSANASAQAPSDPQIVGIVIAADNIDIAYGKLALSKSHDTQVRQFAQQMVTDHSALQKSVGDLGAKLHVTPADSDTAASLKKQAAETTAHLKTLSGAAFDKAYIDNEVGYHQAVIDAVSNVLIPNAKNAELRGALTGAAPLFQGHLEHAKKIQAALASGIMASHTH